MKNAGLNFKKSVIIANLQRRFCSLRNWIFCSTQLMLCVPATYQKMYYWVKLNSNYFQVLQILRITTSSVTRVKHSTVKDVLIFVLTHSKMEIIVIYIHHIHSISILQNIQLSKLQKHLCRFAIITDFLNFCLVFLKLLFKESYK